MKKSIKLILIIAGILILLYLLFSFLFGGSIRPIIYELFFIEQEYDLAGVHYVSVTPYWNRIYTLIFCTLLIAAFLYVQLVDKRVKRETIKHDDRIIHQLEGALHAFLEGKEYPELMKGFGSMETLLYQIKSREENQIVIIEKQTRQKNDLISYLAHDMKTPLASVIGYLSLLNDVQDIPEKQREDYIRITLEKANRLESLIDEFFDITRFNLHDIVVSRGRIEMRFLFEQLCEQFYPILMKKHKNIILEMDEDLIYYGDADKLARAFNNILKNAISYSYPNTDILIHSEQKEQELILQFHNQGDEIPKQKLNLIFEKFYRLDQARSTHSGGAGLGLAIAKEIVNAHGGSICAASSLQETVFRVTLPLPAREDFKDSSRD